MPAGRPTVCLLHADVHVMTRDCWSVSLDFDLTHRHLDPQARRDTYQAACERKMLDEIRLGQAVDHSVRTAVDRALERDHSLCGAEPCSDCR